MINHRDRLQSCLDGKILDRVPVALWRHFPVDDQTAAGLAAATVAFQKAYDFDLVKVTPPSSFCIQDWGATDVWEGSAEGTRAYNRRVIQQPEDWMKLAPLDPLAGRLGQQLETLRLIRQELGGETPILQTIFSPLHQAKNLAGSEQLLIHLRKEPEALLAGLATIARTTQNFVEEARSTGIDGIFYAVQHARYNLLSVDEYLRFGRPFDLHILEPARDLWINMLHLHGSDIMFDLFLDYPLQVINWHDQETPPSLTDGLKRFKGAVCGGLRRDETMLLGDPQAILTEARAAIQATNGERFILGTGCVVFTTVPHGNILAARRSVEAAW
jgi:uroporphyrinogen decarboxylase